MVTTRAGHAKKKSGADLDDDDGANHGMYLEDLFDDGTNHGLSLEDVQARAIEQRLMQCGLAGGAPSLRDPLPARQPWRRSAGFIALGLQQFVFAMAVLKRCMEEGIDKRGTHTSDPV